MPRLSGLSSFDTSKPTHLLSLLHRRRSNVRSINSTLVPPKAKGRQNVVGVIETQTSFPVSGGPSRDGDYYMDESKGGFCVFRVENVLFKVHRFILARDSSAFESMFSFPVTRSGQGAGCSDHDPVTLSDTVEQFRDLLWVLYALPSDLQTNKNSDPSLSINRLLNIAEMTNKYNFISFESWAMDRLYLLTQSPTGPLHAGSPDVCARILNVAILCNHVILRDIIIDKLIARILWQKLPPAPILAVSQKHGLRKLQGVAFYGQLIAMEHAGRRTTRNATRPMFDATLSVEERIRFLSAYHSLVNLWECLRTSPPTFQPYDCDCHSTCVAIWKAKWLEAGRTDETLQCGSADVLGRLKSVDRHIRKLASEGLIPLECALAAFEAVSTTADDLIDGLMHHFDGI